MSATPVLAATAWASNAAMILDVHRLGYLRDEDHVLDPTFGRGNFWSIWCPEKLTAHDLFTLDGVDFTNLPHPDGAFDAVAFDPPYRLNGTPDPEFDERYGTATATTWQARHTLIRDGITECTRVLRPGGYLLVKVQDQVCSGKVRWQTREFADHAEAAGNELVDVLHMLGGRPQPEGRRQVHARRNMSTLLVLRKGK